MTTSTNRDPVDLLGEVKAQIAALEAVEKDLRDQIESRGPGAYEGELFRATVSKPGERKTPDATLKARIDALVEEHISPRFIKAHTNVTPVKPSVKVVARTGVNVAA
jgi:hypothetical protein